MKFRAQGGKGSRVSGENPYSENSRILEPLDP